MPDLEELQRLAEGRDRRAAASAIVPLEPTQAMLDAADKVLDADPRFVAAAYRAMVAAAGAGVPTPPLNEEQIKAIAQQWFVTGENQLRADGYYYRSLGTVTNVRESDLIAFAREVLARSASWPALREAIAGAPAIRAAIKASEELLARQAGLARLSMTCDDSDFDALRTVLEELKP